MQQKQTAVEYLVEQLLPKVLSAEQYYHIEQAKEMEKQQIMLAIAKHLPIDDGVITAVQKAEQYYNQEYGK